MGREKSNIGIYGIGVHLPEEIRTNDYWPESVYSKWWDTSGGRLDRPVEPETTDPGRTLVREMMARWRDDPFKGSRERRIMAPGVRTTDMEVRAATAALDAAGVVPGDVDFLLGQTTLPDNLLAPNVCRVHDALKLKRSCYSLQTEGICAAFLLQLELAEALVHSGRYRLGLLIQSSGTSRYHTKLDDPMAPWIGDAATAVVVGPVSLERGMIAHSVKTDGRYYDAAVVAGDPSRHWSEAGHFQAHIKDAARSRELLLDTVNLAKEVLDDAFVQANVSSRDIRFFGCHQGFAWLREAVQRFCGMENAASLDTFAWAGSTLACNIPLVLQNAEQKGLLRNGDLTALFAGASGVILKSVLMRWGVT